MLRKRMDECLDGDYQRFSILSGDVQREHWVEGNPELETMMNSLSDDEVKTIKRGGQALGGYLPVRKVQCEALPTPELALFGDVVKGSETRKASTTMSMVRILHNLLKDQELGPYIVPIVPDEARTFGMDGLFPVAGIYSPAGQQ